VVLIVIKDPMSIYWKSVLSQLTINVLLKNWDGAHLTELKCKLKCLRCGYFEDCSDGGTNLAQETYRFD